jgi:large subunit ribosomal protein L25
MKIELKATKREQLGKANKILRNEGCVPAVVYGKGFENLNVTLDFKEFVKVFKEAGHSSVVDLVVKGEKEPVKVLVVDTQEGPIRNEVIHVDFHKVDLTQKTTAEVPVEITGVSPIVKSGEGILLTLLSEIEVEALPLDLPHQITVDVTRLEKIGDGITIKDLPIDHSKVSVVGHRPDDLVVKIDYAVQIEKEEEVKSVEDVEVLKEKKEGEEGAESGVVEEGETDKSRSKEEAKPEKEEKKEKEKK